MSVIAIIALCLVGAIIPQVSAQCATPNSPSGPVCNGNGLCQNNVTCVCSASYTGELCDYERKQELIAFLLSFFVGTLGCDRFYLGYIGIAVGKLILGMASCILICIGACMIFGATACCGEGAGIACSVIFGILAVACIFSSFLWWIIDWSFLLAHRLPDVNGVALKPF